MTITVHPRPTHLTHGGGQTGADRFGLDFAIKTGLEHGGYVPRGRNPEEYC
jgi:hypothetical protein